MGGHDDENRRADDEPLRRDAGSAPPLAWMKGVLAAAWIAAGQLLRDPVAGLGRVHAEIAPERRRVIGGVFALVAAIGLSLAGGLMIRALFGGIATAYGAGFGFDFAAFVRGTLVYLVTIFAGAGGVLVVAGTARAAITGSSAVFVAGAAFLPAGVASLAGALVAALLPTRIGMYLASLLLLAGACYVVLVLNAGLRRIVMMDERRAAPSTVAVLAVALTCGSIVSWIF